MRRYWLGISCLGLLTTLGCTMCANPHDCKFGLYGGKRARANHARGRLASVFDPAEEVHSFGDVDSIPSDNLGLSPDSDQPASPTPAPLEEDLPVEPSPIELPDETPGARDGDEVFDPVPEEDSSAPLDSPLPAFPQGDDSSDLPDLEL